ncbi:MAG: hypothetical protein UR25_C0001G0063 [Candidatus Nomurabacteria bacterium GW2011_GWE1_32_28]|uniref:Uncharacterized protein n=1 Tax=Candidatus Nomurabacteria bacterium GW2011_GWF1_31_48 TaxID=1618767 RepID=A0A0G0BHY3_9BACT|nr:MAG: hypothetical protein UR10_C0001G0016 [Candidatus Nomurabacteria bacterium GW2011_GWF2_30_133]KKP28894.1 MAG: hypothetical protein UR18_C0001G0015 [Candidatus Nomurabacteria bacterium GW2011_GWE2_31_40]KKP30632.1 MAG: hypothetical protein UR19_C0001G0016 [Candidatus Nomurabacteria bacterium GW2011_GWF1_31_48]KKP35150.1 MAG: hypothetical protein UR25_C0001G0063 [Candidatus Nomurabacteria bacterium GW2011_GWE1_32_28]HAS80460.1 hypothetical protein [Candidatus Nomurabacteria bacterium]
MRKINLKIFLIIAFVLTGVFSLFFISNTKVIAQTEDEIIVTTTGYSVLSPDIFVFTGDYSGNFEKKGFTTYFQFKKQDSFLKDIPDLDDSNDREETIKIVRPSTSKTTVDEADVFFTSPELNLFSTYYFRGVGYFNDYPDQKFYGNVLSLSTGTVPYGYSYPYSFDINTSNDIQNGDASKCKVTQIFTDGTCKEKNEPACDFTTQELVDNLCKDKVIDPNPNPDSDPTFNPSSDSTDFTSGLVKCGTQRYPKGMTIDGKDVGGMVSNPCGFQDILDMIDLVIDFLLKNIVLPLSAIMFAYAGFELVTSGGSTEKKSKAKKIFTDVAIGLIIVVAAYLIIQSILSIVGYTDMSSWQS